MELVAAGVEGGSKRGVEEDWGLADVADLRRHWAAMGPPTHIAVAIFAAAWGVTLTRREADAAAALPDGLDLTPGTPRLADMSAGITPPIAGGDTVAASRAIVAKLMEGSAK
jgi:hypothetical protein